MNENAVNKIEFSFTYSLDPDKFLRRACPKCGLHFKILASPDMISSLLASPFKQQVSTVDPVSQNQDASNSELRTCPYCGHQEKPQSFNTDEMLHVVNKLVRREYILPHILSALDDFGEGLNQIGRKSRGDFISFDISYKREPAMREQRPIVGPELPDMNKVELLCCHKEIKIKSGWYGTINCPYCAEQLRLC